MRALKFTLSGKTAFFKKPEVNAYCYFTFGQIHKAALLGMFGAILGYQGYGQKEWESKKKKAQLTEEYPEFYERLKDLKVSIVPKNEKGYIPKKVQFFNNSVGYASKEQGGNLIVKEQWLEEPIWEIFVLLDCQEAEKLAEFIVNGKCVYMPYLGKNDHPANIRNAQIVELDQEPEKEVQFACLFPKETGELLLPDEEDEIQEFKYEEKLPVGLDAYTNLYVYDTFCYTNLPVRMEKGFVVRTEKKMLIFY